MALSIVEQGVNKTKAKTHDYSDKCRRWGHDITVVRVKDGGLGLLVIGWGSGIQEGDYIILQNKERTTRYRAQMIAYYGDPKDQWQARLVFAPRPSVVH